jgi:D-3-phosphoglycerate dehydrogenase
MKVLITAPIEFLPYKKELLKRNEIVYAYQSSREEILNLEKENKFSGWVCSPCPTYSINSELLKSFSSLRILATPSTGSNHIDKAYLQRNNIDFYSLKGTEIVNKIFASSEYTFALLMMVLKKCNPAINSVSEGNWRKSENEFRGHELHNKKIGIVGYGRIGSNLSRYCNAFKMQVCAYDPYVDIYDEWVEVYSSLDKMIQEVDILCPCVHLDQTTQNLINRKRILSMKKGSFIINTSRGEVIDEDAIVEAIKSNHLAGCGLDVIHDEFNTSNKSNKIINASVLNKNLIISPHIAGLTFESETKAQTGAIVEVLNKLGIEFKL